MEKMGRRCAIALLCLLVSGSTIAKDKKKKTKSHPIMVSGVIEKKSMFGDMEVIEIKDKKGDSFMCALHEPDPRFRDFHAGDELAVSGTIKDGSSLIGGCYMGIWTSK